MHNNTRNIIIKVSNWFHVEFKHRTYQWAQKNIKTVCLHVCSKGTPIIDSNGTGRGWCLTTPQPLKGVLLCSFTKSWFCFGGVLEHAIPLSLSNITCYCKCTKCLVSTHPQNNDRWLPSLGLTKPLVTPILLAATVSPLTTLRRVNSEDSVCMTMGRSRSRTYGQNRMRMFHLLKIQVSWRLSEFSYSKREQIIINH